MDADMQRAEPQEFSRVLSSMCTEPHPAAREAAERFLATNPGDPGTYESVAKLERRAVDLLGRVAGLEDAAGYVCSGGTEANVQAVRIARNRADTRDPNFVAPASAHFSFRKAADVLGVELRTAPLEDYRANLDGVAELIDDDTVLVVGVAGSTEYGRVDPIPAMAEMASDVGALCHVDAAWGGDGVDPAVLGGPGDAHHERGVVVDQFRDGVEVGAVVFQRRGPQLDAEDVRGLPE